ncbi:MAG: thioredoxin fold domain-containing protein [Pseudomonadota bacterium]|nr:thioredoxin fold domain-containing protein [Pseudomonadota bacterium]
MSVSSPILAQEVGDQLSAGMVNPGYVEKPAWFKDSFLDIRDDINEATESGKRVMLYFYQDGCPYCERLVKENMAQQKIAESLQKNFDVIAINMWGDREVVGLDGRETTEKEFAIANKIMFTPTLQFLNEQGGQVLRLNGYVPPHKFTVALDYVSQKKEKDGSFRDYMAKTGMQAGSGKLYSDDSFLQPPFDLSVRLSAKPLLVFFEQKRCPPCDELHNDVLKQAGSAELLEEFDVVLLDMWSKTPLITPQGKRVSAENWGRELKLSYVPSMLFFDDKGVEVFRAEGWLRAFHVQSSMEYVSSKSYLKEKEFQRYVEARAAKLRKQGIVVDLMK